MRCRSSCTLIIFVLSKCISSNLGIAASRFLIRAFTNYFFGLSADIQSWSRDCAKRHLADAGACGHCTAATHLHLPHLLKTRKGKRGGEKGEWADVVDVGFLNFPSVLVLLQLAANYDGSAAAAYSESVMHSGVNARNIVGPSRGCCGRDNCRIVFVVTNEPRTDLIDRQVFAAYFSEPRSHKYTTMRYVMRTLSARLASSLYYIRH